jgi:hypothetical protein
MLTLRHAGATFALRNSEPARVSKRRGGYVVRKKNLIPSPGTEAEESVVVKGVRRTEV